MISTKRSQAQASRGNVELSSPPFPFLYFHYLLDEIQRMGSRAAKSTFHSFPERHRIITLELELR